MKIRIVVRIGLLLALTLALGQPAAGQGTAAPAAAPSLRSAAQAPRPPAGTPPPFQPAPLRYDAKGIGLLDAVRLTLEHDPNIRLRETDQQRLAGALQAQHGIFDLTFRGFGDFQRFQSELTDSEKRSEQDKRDELDARIVTVRALSNSLLRAISNLQDNRVYTNPRAVNLTEGIADKDVSYQMEVLQSELVLFDDILKRQSDPVIRADVEDLRKKTVLTTIQTFTAQRDQIGSAPDELQKRRDDLGDAPEERWNTDAEVRLQFDKLLRSGIVLSPFFDLRYNNANYVGKDSWDPLKGGLGVKPVYQAQVGFDVVLPLLRGRGRAAVAVGEIAAGFDLEASRLSVLHQKSASVLSTVLAYWDVRAAAEQVEVLHRSVELQTELGTMTRALIAAGERPRAEEARVLASTADAQARLDAAERRLYDARIELARTIGASLADVQAIPMAIDPFPRPAGNLQGDPAGIDALIRQALAQRLDHLAARKIEESGLALVEGARIDTRSLLNVSLSGWGTATQEDNPKFDRWVFRSGRASVDYEKPFGNNAAVGRLAQSEADLKQARIDASEIARAIGLTIARDAAALRMAAERLRWAEEAVKGYDQTIVDERNRLKTGDSSLVDTILTEQQTTSARLALVGAQQEYASLLAQLRYDAGLLVQDGAGGSSIGIENLVAVPAPLIRR